MISANLFLDTRQTTDNNGIVKVVVNFNGKRKMFTTSIKCGKSEWKKLTRNITNNGLSNKIIDESIIALYDKCYGKNGKLTKAQSVIDEISNHFNFDNFKQKFYADDSKNKPSNPTDLLQTLKSISEALLKKNKFSSANLYYSTAQSLERFTSKTIIPFDMVTIDFLNKYQKWMLAHGKVSQKDKTKGGPASISTVGIYCRYISVAVNEYIRLLKPTNYESPFSKNKFQIPSAKNGKKALTKPHIKQIIDFQPENLSQMHRAKDFWLLSYFCNGMNFADISHLKKTDYESNKLHFFRRKTISTRKNNIQKVSVSLVPIASQIIETWKDKTTDSHLFGILNDSMTERQKYDTNKQFIKLTNKYIRRILSILEIDIKIKIGTYHARHSFATVLKNSGVSSEFIKEALDHQTLAMTENYLDSFEDEQVQEFMKNLY